MKILKFKVWDREQGKMYGPYTLLQLINGAQDTSINTDEAIYIPYTGYTDKRGKEIYQGDIIYNEITDYEYTVRDIRHFPIKFVTDNREVLGYEIVDNIFEA